LIGEVDHPEEKPEEMVTRNLVSVRDVLEVIDEFEEFESDGVSASLVGWELLAPGLVVTSALRLADARGMIARTGWDPTLGESLWRVTPLGRERLGAAGSVAQPARLGSTTHFRAAPPEEVASASGSSSSEILSPTSASQSS
jgi:hypothetical protein